MQRRSGILVGRWSSWRGRPKRRAQESGAEDTCETRPGTSGRAGLRRAGS
jgi:hypothetical protein